MDADATPDVNTDTDPDVNVNAPYMDTIVDHDVDVDI